MALSKHNRLKKSRELDSVFKEGNALKGNFLFIKYKERATPTPRLSFIISTKVVRSAAERNRIRRILSETVRRNLLNFKKGYDIALTVKRKTEEDLLVAELLDLLRQKFLSDEKNLNKNN